MMFLDFLMTAVCFTSLGAGVSWWLRSRRVPGEIKEGIKAAVRSEEERRVEAMRIYGRETWERPEHEGRIGSRVTDVDLGS